MHYLNFKNICLCLLKTFILTAIIVGVAILFYHNYDLGVAYCNYLKVPIDFSLSAFGLGMALEVTIVLCFLESCLGIFLLKYFRRFKIVESLYKFLYIDFESF